LVTSIPANPTWRPWPPFRCRPASGHVSYHHPFACQGLVNRLLPSLTLPHGEVIDATDAWSALHDSSPWQKETQSVWDDLACRDSLATLLDTPSPWNHCRLLTTQKSHTAAWSFPIANVRNLLSPDELRIAIALRTGASIFESTECCCGKFVDRLGLHGLSCIKNAGCFPRHSAINSILKRSLTCIGLPFVLEPVGLTRDRRPGGLTLNPWYRGRRLVWDATVVDTFAECHYIASAAIPGSVATDAETDKWLKYNDLLDNYYFNQLQWTPLGCMANPLPPSWAVLQRNSLTFQATPGSNSGFTSTCLWPWSEGTPPAYWPMCKFDLILATLSALTSVPAHHLPLFNE